MLKRYYSNNEHNSRAEERIPPVVQKFYEYFQVRKNLVYERASFNLAYQLADESAEQFITRLCQLAVNCEFGDLKNEMIHDRLIIGIREGQLSERLQMESDLTLQKAEKLVQQRAAVSQQQKVLKTPVENKPQLEATKQQRRATRTPQHIDCLHRELLPLSQEHNHSYQNVGDAKKPLIHVKAAPNMLA